MGSPDVARERRHRRLSRSEQSLRPRGELYLDPSRRLVRRSAPQRDPSDRGAAALVARRAAAARGRGRAPVDPGDGADTLVAPRRMGAAVSPAVCRRPLREARVRPRVRAGLRRRHGGRRDKGQARDALRRAARGGGGRVLPLRADPRPGCEARPLSRGRIHPDGGLDPDTGRGSAGPAEDRTRLSSGHVHYREPRHRRRAVGARSLGAPAIVFGRRANRTSLRPRARSAAGPCPMGRWPRSGRRGAARKACRNDRALGGLRNAGGDDEAGRGLEAPLDARRSRRSCTSASRGAP